MPFQPSPLLHGARAGTVSRAPRETESSLAPAERLAPRAMGAPIARAWLVSHLPAERAVLAPLGAEVVSRRAPVAVNDRDGSVATPITAMMLALAWRSVLAVPLYDATGAVFAVLAVADPHPRRWSEMDVLRLQDLARLTAQAHPAGRGDARAWLRRLAHEAAQDARRKSEAWLALVFNGTTDLTFLLAVEGRGRYRCVAVNDSYLALTGRDGSQVVGRPLGELLPRRALGRAIARYDAAVERGEPVTFEETLELPIGRVTLDTTLTPIVDDEGRCTHLLGVGRDVSGRKRQEADLLAAKEGADVARSRAEAAARAALRTNSAQRELLAQLSHELRTPLNAILGFAALLRDEAHERLDPRELSHLDRVLTNGETLLEQVSDLVDLFRLECGALSLSPAAVPLAPLLRSVVDSLEPLLVSAGVRIDLDLPETIGRVETDEERLHQLLTHLVSHAVATSPDRTVMIRAVSAVPGMQIRLEILAAASPSFSLAFATALCEALGHPLSRSDRQDGTSRIAIDFRPARP